MAAAKVSVTVDEEPMEWARSAAKKRRMTLSAVIAEALAFQREHQARERYLKEALAGLSGHEIERRTAEAYREIFGQPNAAE
jgi:hypothetical protein